MKKIYFLFLALIATYSFGQGTETFDNFPSTNSSYVDGTFAGQDGSTWTHTQCRGDVSITGQSIMIGRNRSPQAEFYSGTISGGVGTISFNYMQAFSTNVNLNVLINGVVAGTVTSSGEQNVVKASGAITVNQPGDVVIKFINVANSSGQVVVDDVTWTGYTGTADPSLTITSPTDNQVFPAGTTSVPVSLIVQNFDVDELPENGGTGDGHIHWSINGQNQSMKYDTNDENVTTVDGETYTVVMTLVDNMHVPISPAVSATVNFSVAYPCDLQLGAITTTCDNETNGTDTYTTTIDFTGGGTSTYTLSNGMLGTIGGDDPSMVASGTITITGVDEGVDFTLNILGDAGNSSCDIDRNISAPTCLPATCAAVGSIIITEIMQNPSQAGDPAGEYFEVYNTTAAAIDMAGWIISDAGSDSHAISSSLVVPAGGYVVIGNAATTAPALDYSYGTDINLANGDDEIILTCSGTIIDEVYYDGGPNFPDPSGAAMELSTTALDGTSNDNGGNWGEATTDLGNGDLGTPGAANGFTLSVASLQVNTFNVYPNPSNTGFVNIVSKTNEAINVTVFNVLGKQVLSQTLNNNQLNISKLNNGVYILQISQNGNTTTKKLVVK